MQQHSLQLACFWPGLLLCEDRRVQRTVGQVWAQGKKDKERQWVCWLQVPALPLNQQKHFSLGLNKFKKKKCIFSGLLPL